MIVEAPLCQRLFFNNGSIKLCRVRRHLCVKKSTISLLLQHLVANSCYLKGWLNVLVFSQCDSVKCARYASDNKDLLACVHGHQELPGIVMYRIYGGNFWEFLK